MTRLGRVRLSGAMTGALACALLLAPARSARAADPEVTVRVDGRVELMSVIFMLAGNPEYNRPRVPKYAQAAWQHFGPHKTHKAVRYAAYLRKKTGVSFDAVMSLAVHLKDVKTLAEAVPLVPRPASLDARWPPEETRRFLDHARDFVRVTKFASFLKKHASLHEQTGKRMQEALAEHARLGWIEGFFGVPPKASFALALGMLNGGQCYGPRVLHPDGREDIHCVLGVWLVDEAGDPRFDKTVLPTVVHEFCHSFCNPLVDAHIDALGPVGARLWPGVAEQMKRQAYGNPKTMLYESFVRASVVRYMHAVEGEAGGRKQAAEEKGHGFLWIDELAGLFARYEREREKHKTLDAFMPRIVEGLEAYAKELEAQEAHRPKLVSMSPKNGATDVDPKVGAIVVTFDRKMKDGGWAFVGGGPKFPKTLGRPSYDKAVRTLTLPVALEPDHEYEFWLNRGKYASFQSAEGVPLRSIHVTFRTGKAR